MFSWVCTDRVHGFDYSEHCALMMTSKALDSVFQQFLGHCANT